MALGHRQVQGPQGRQVIPYLPRGHRLTQLRDDFTQGEPIGCFRKQGQNRSLTFGHLPLHTPRRYGLAQPEA